LGFAGVADFAGSAARPETAMRVDSVNMHPKVQAVFMGRSLSRVDIEKGAVDCTCRPGKKRPYSLNSA
jgi:hypothetical protein